MGRARSRHFKLHEEHALNHRPLGVEALGIQGAAEGLNPIVNDDNIRKEARTDYVCAPSCTLHLQAVRQKDQSCVHTLAKNKISFITYTGLVRVSCNPNADRKY